MNSKPHVQHLVVMHDGVIVGRLHAGAKPRDIAFQYDANWLNSGFDLAPDSLAFTLAPHKVNNLSMINEAPDRRV